MMRARKVLSGVATLALVTLLAVVGCASPIGSIADTLLANEVRSDDHELPQTAYAIPASADGVQLIGGQGIGLGCSLPPGAQALAFTSGATQAPIALRMRQACVFHDYCYRHGNATYGYTQADCDFLLQQHAFRICKYVNRYPVVGKCETDARKLTLGVRLGGFTPFRRARATEDEAASTFLEFDAYPVRAREYEVVRIADAPADWVRAGHLPKAAYVFNVRPSGSIVHIRGWTHDGTPLFKSPIDVRGAHDFITVPPLVVREAPGGKEWLVWWQRLSLNETGGRLALLPPGEATRDDWKVVSGEMSGRALRELAKQDAPANGQAARTAFAFADNIDAFFSEIHAIQGMDRPGQVRLAAISKNGCVPGSEWACLVDLELDTIAQKLKVFGEKKKPPMYTVRADACAEGKGAGDCNVYRNYVTAPTVSQRPDGTLVTWLLRGKDDNGKGYGNAAIVRRFAFGATPDVPAVKRDILELADFSERSEPAILLDAAAPSPAFLSLESGKKTFAVHIRAVPKEGQPAENKVVCAAHADRSWLQRSVAYVQDPKVPGRGYLVFSRVQFESRGSADTQASAGLELLVTTISGNRCTDQRQQRFPGFFKRPKVAKTADEAFMWFADKVRGGQLVAADVSGDRIPDLVQVGRLPKSEDFDSAVLTGSLDSGALRFTRLGAAAH